MKRREFSKKVKLAAFERAKGRCENCTALLHPGKYQYDHVLADGLGGEPTLTNCQVICNACHGAKTHGEDRPAMQKADNVRVKHIGARRKKPPPRWRRKINGQTEPYDGPARMS